MAVAGASLWVALELKAVESDSVWLGFLHATLGRPFNFHV